jgi:hypothetical protein
MEAIEIRVVDVPRNTSEVQTGSVSAVAPQANQPSTTDRQGPRASTPSLEQALHLIRNDPQAVGRLLAHLERRRADGTLAAPEWLPVRNGLRLITRELSPEIERPSNAGADSPSARPLH